MNAMALLPPAAAQRSPTTNGALSCGHRGILNWAVQLPGNLVRIMLDTATSPALGVPARPPAGAGRTDLVVDRLTPADRGQ